MITAIKYGLVLGVIVAALGFVLGMLGLHTNEMAPMSFVIVVIIINALIVVLAVRRLASTSNWVQQVRNGLVLGLVAAAIVFLGSWLMTAIVFPNYYAEFAEAARARAVAEGMTAEEIVAAVELVTGTPVGSAFQGALGTVITSVVVAAIAGIFNRADKS
ncbi:MAG: DUF4199 family protein [Gammaproteobacteria bacterium]|nr:DUF4199 family protein [Gammaproteobacteria bacterium]